MIAVWIYAALVLISSIAVIWGAAQFVGIRFYIGIGVPFAFTVLMKDANLPILAIILLTLIGLIWTIPFFCINTVVWFCALPFYCGKDVINYFTK